MNISSNCVVLIQLSRSEDWVEMRVEKHLRGTPHLHLPHMSVFSALVHGFDRDLEEICAQGKMALAGEVNRKPTAGL